MPLGTEICLDQGDIVLDGDPCSSPMERSKARPHFSTHFALARSPISATAELLSVTSAAFNLSHLQLVPPLGCPRLIVSPSMFD